MQDKKGVVYCEVLQEVFLSYKNVLAVRSRWSQMWVLKACSTLCDNMIIVYLYIMIFVYLHNMIIVYFDIINFIFYTFTLIQFLYFYNNTILYIYTFSIL